MENSTEPISNLVQFEDQNFGIPQFPFSHENLAGKLILIIGTQGSGKTMLVEEIKRTLNDFEPHNAISIMEITRNKVFRGKQLYIIDNIKTVLDDILGIIPDEKRTIVLTQRWVPLLDGRLRSMFDLIFMFNCDNPKQLFRYHDNLTLCETFFKQMDHKCLVFSNNYLMFNEIYWHQSQVVMRPVLNISSEQRGISTPEISSQARRLETGGLKVPPREPIARGTESPPSQGETLFPRASGKLKDSRDQIKRPYIKPIPPAKALPLQSSTPETSSH